MKNTIHALLPIAAMVALPLGALPAAAAASTPTTVTIQSVSADLRGTVSPKDASGADRKVVAGKQKGTRRGGVDVRLASDMTSVTDGFGKRRSGKLYRHRR